MTNAQPVRAPFSLDVAQTAFTVSLGSKGERKAWTATVTGDYAEFPQNIRGFLMEAGFRYMMSQAASGADRESAKRKEAKPGAKSKDYQGEGGTAYSPAELEARALALALERVELFRKGETGKVMTVLSAIDRRAFDNVCAALRERARQRGETMTPEVLAETARVVLASAKGQHFKDEAAKQLEAEQAKARASASVLDDFDL